MALDIKRIFDKYKVQWKDRGPNTSRGNINISCPLCNKTTNPDHGYHMIISDIGEVYCFRNPAHASHITYVFYLLKIPRSEYGDIKFKETVRSAVSQDRDFSSIRFFHPAEDSLEAMSYLSTRLFSRPADIAKKFNLMYSPEGEWAGRLIIPMTIGWTGRAMRTHIDPRYKTESTEDGFFLFQQGSTSVMILEGAIDGMRVASISTEFDVIGKSRIGVSSAVIAFLKQQRYISIYNVPDGNVPFNQTYKETKLLKSYCTESDVKQFDMPTDKKDFGILEENEARKWLIQNAK